MATMMKAGEPDPEVAGDQLEVLLHLALTGEPLSREMRLVLLRLMPFYSALRWVGRMEPGSVKAEWLRQIESAQAQLLAGP